MKHAYLILAHNEFEVLQKLVQAIDDERNDIFIHFDAKVKVRPRLSTTFSRIILTPHRIDVRWGDANLIQAEMELFKTAVAHGEYDYLHLLSGVDMPLKSQDEIHRFFNQHRGKEFIGFANGNTACEIDRKVRYWHLFPHNFRSESLLIRTLRASFLRLQMVLGMKRNRHINFYKGPNWVSITQAFAEFALHQQADFQSLYDHTFCPDEIFLQTLCRNSNFKKQLYNVHDESSGCLRAIPWKHNLIQEWKLEDVPQLLESKFLFARKFTSAHMEVVNAILNPIKKKPVL